MLTVIYGDNYAKRSSALEKTLQSIKTPVLRMEASSLSPEDLIVRASGVSLFEEATCLIISHMQDDEALWNTVIKNSILIAGSKTLYLVAIESEIDGETLEVLEKSTAKIIPCLEDKKASTFERATLSPFALSDALFAHDKKEAWVMYYKLLELGTPVEEIESAIIWAMKTLALVSVTNKLSKDKQKTDLKPFVLTKVSRGVTAWKGKDIMKAYGACISCVETYRFYDDYPMYLEKTLLEILS
jgi:DNA polymerase III delta subunit